MQGHRQVDSTWAVPLALALALMMATGPLTGCSSNPSSATPAVGLSEAVEAEPSASTDPEELLVGTWNGQGGPWVFYEDGTFTRGGGDHYGRYRVVSQFDKPALDITWSDGSGSMREIVFDGPDKLAIAETGGYFELTRDK